MRAFRRGGADRLRDESEPASPSQRQEPSDTEALPGSENSALPISLLLVVVVASLWQELTLAGGGATTEQLPLAAGLEELWFEGGCRLLPKDLRVDAGRTPRVEVPGLVVPAAAVCLCDIDGDSCRLHEELWFGGRVRLPPKDLRFPDALLACAGLPTQRRRAARGLAGTRGLPGAVCRGDADGDSARLNPAMAEPATDSEDCALRSAALARLSASLVRISA